MAELARWCSGSLEAMAEELSDCQDIWATGELKALTGRSQRLLNTLGSLPGLLLLLYTLGNGAGVSQAPTPPVEAQ